MIDKEKSPDEFPNYPNITRQRSNFSLAALSIQVLWEQFECLTRFKPGLYPPMHLELKNSQGEVYDAYRHAIGAPFMDDTVDPKLLFRYMHHVVPAIREAFQEFKEAWLAEELVPET